MAGMNIPLLLLVLQYMVPVVNMTMVHVLMGPINECIESGLAKGKVDNCIQ